jgi:putative tryptophan/tyrosine transport system substrate-binding protein
MQRREFITFLAGALSGWSSSVGAQAVIRVIGYLSSGTAARPVDAGFYQGLSEIGYVEGQNLAIEYRWAEGQYDRLPGLVADLVGRNIEVIATIGMPSALAAKKATSTIPIVFNVGTDPVADGLVASLARPGGNLTGVTVISTELMPKRLELLSELLPRASVFALIVHPNNASAGPQSRNLREAARAKGVQLHTLKAGTESDIDAAFAALVQLHVDALVVGTDVFFVSQREQFVSLAARYAIPAIYEGNTFATAGGLISYGPSLTALNRQAGIYVGKILKGVTPTMLPVSRPDKFELVINLKTAKTLGLTVPQSLLVRADEVIE